MIAPPPVQLEPAAARAEPACAERVGRRRLVDEQRDGRRPRRRRNGGGDALAAAPTSAWRIAPITAAVADDWLRQRKPPARGARLAVVDGDGLSAILLRRDRRRSRPHGGGACRAQACHEPGRRARDSASGRCLSRRRPSRAPTPPASCRIATTLGGESRASSRPSRARYATPSTGPRSVLARGSNPITGRGSTAMIRADQDERDDELRHR